MYVTENNGDVSIVDFILVLPEMIFFGGRIYSFKQNKIIKHFSLIYE